MTLEDTFQTLAQEAPETLLKEKSSKFLGFAYPISSADDVKPLIDNLKKIHPNAVHHCYAFRLGNGEIYERANDDGEPSNTAGAPILGQIKSFDLTNTLVVVVRYYGGIKLGVGGLISTYRASAQLTLEGAEIVTQEIRSEFELHFQYEHMNKVMRIIREKQLEIVSQKMDMNCTLIVSVKKSQADRVPEYFAGLFQLNVKAL